MAKKQYIGCENFTKITLPSGYTQVEYIQSSGTQYINTGFTPNQDTSIIIDTVPLSVGTGQTDGGYLYGSGYPVQQNGFEAYVYGGTFSAIYNGTQVNGNSVTVGQRLIVQFNKNVCIATADGTTVLNNTFTYTTFTSPVTLTLFMLPRSSKYYGSIRLYSCKIYDNGTLIRDFIPCKNSSGTAGLYDLVNNTFYTNEGTGTFIAGATYSNLAHKIKKGYFGVEINIPIYEEKIGTVSITASNLSEYFGVANESYYFAGSGSTFTSNNKGQNSSSAVSTWTAKQDMSAVSFSYSVSSEASYDKLMIVVKGTTIANSISGTASSTWSGSLSKGDTIYLSYSKDVSQAGGNDCGTLSNMSITTTVKTQVGTETISLAHKIKKAYIGIKNIARPFWGAGTLTYYGTTTKLSTARYGLAAASVGNYALFGGGAYRSGYNVTASTAVDTYNTSLTKGTATNLYWLNGGEGTYSASVGNYALFTSTQTVDVFDSSLVKSEINGISIHRSGISSTTVGNYALFAGGTSGSSYALTSHDTVDAISSSLVCSTPSVMSSLRISPGATNVGDYALFAGGHWNVYTSSGTNSSVDAYDKSLTRSTPDSLSSERSYLTGVTVGGYALFAGGSTVVEAYNTSLTRSIATALSTSLSNLGGTTLGDYALLGSGTVVNAYDTSLVRSVPNGFSTTHVSPGTTAIGDFALFGGGGDGSAYQTDIVDVYTLV